MLWGWGLLLLVVLPSQPAFVKESGVQVTLTPAAVSPVQLGELLKGSAHSRKAGLEPGRHRSRRSVFMHSGVRICPQETVTEVLASHQAYYQLRVCQEAVWEAFRIFLDRIPGTNEYQRWVHMCQHQSLCISDLAKNFSSSEEHMRMVHRRMSRIRDRRPPPPRRTVTPTPTLAEVTGPEAQTLPPSTAPTPATAAPTTSTSIILTATRQKQGPELPNVVPDSPVEQVVEFWINLVDPGYRELLDDQDSPQYVDLAQHLQDQMHHAFDKLPGFKSIHVLGISETQDIDGPGGISVHYSLVFDINSPELNLEDSETGSPQIWVDSGLRDMVTTALKEEASLPIDLDSLSFDAESVVPPALTSTSAPLVNESSEPDSHNELEVITEEPEVDKSRLAPPPLTPLEKENALVTLLDPTAVPDDSDSRMAVATVKPEQGGSDHPPTLEEVTDESEAISESQPELSNQEDKEEELLIFSHKIETIHHSETGELVRDYILTPPTLIELQTTDTPYISLSPNLLPEEDLSPVDADDMTLDIVPLLPTPQMGLTLTTSPAEEGPTTLSDTTGQLPTQPITALEEEEAVNALPDEEDHLVLPEVYNPGVPTITDPGAEVESLSPEIEIDAIKILEPTPEIKVFLPEVVDEVVDESNKEVVVPEVEEKDEEFQGVEVFETPSSPESEPEPSEIEVLKETDTVLEPEEDIVAPTKEFEELEEGIFEVLYPSLETDRKFLEDSEVVVPEEDVDLVVSEVAPEPEGGGLLVEVSEEEVVEPSGSEEAEEIEHFIEVKPEQEIILVPKVEDEVVESQKEEEAKIPEPEVIQVESTSKEEGVVDPVELTPEPKVPEGGGEVDEGAKAELPQEVEVVEVIEVEMLPPELKPEPGTPVVEVIGMETEVVKAPKPEQDLGKDADISEVVEIVEPETPVPEVTKTGVKVVKDLGKDSEPSEMVEVEEVSPEPEEDVKPEEEVVILPMPEEEPVDVLGPELPSKPEDILDRLPQEQGEDVGEDVEPVEEVVVILGPEPEPVDILEPELPSETKDEVVVDLKPEGEVVVVPLPEKEPEDISEPELTSEPEDEVVVDLKPEGEVVVVPLPEKEPEDISEPELTSEPEDEVLVDLKPEGEVVVVPLPEKEPEDISEPELTSEPEDEVVVDLKPEGEVVVVPLPEEEPEDISEPELTSEPEDKVVVDLKPEGEVVVVPLPEEEPEDISEPELTSEPEDEVVVDLKPEGEVVVVPLPEEEPEDISEPELTSEPEDEVVADLKPEGEVVVVPLPEEEPQDISEPEFPSESHNLVDKSDLEPDLIVVLPPEEDLAVVLEAEPTEPEAEPATDVTEPPAESIKILRPLDGRGTGYFGEDTLHVVEESDFLEPFGPERHGPFEDNLPVVPTDIQYSPEESLQEKPVINDLYPPEDDGGVDIPEEETTPADVEMETLSTATEATALEKEEHPKATEDRVELSEETPKTDSSTEKDIGVTIGPVSDLFPTPPASSLDASEVASPSPTIDTGLFKVSQEPRPGSLQDEIKTEPSIIIIDEDLVLETVEDVAPSRTEPPFTSEDVIQAGVQDLAVELDQTDIVPTEATEESPVDEGSGLHSAMEETTTGVSVTAPPPLKYVTTPHMTTATQGRELVVFFSLRVTNMDFSDDLFNKTSSEYRTLENTFLDVLLPFLQANLTGFRNLEILNFRKGSVVVNSRMKFVKSVPYNITQAVQCVLEEFCSAAKHLHIQIDTHSLDVEPADQANPCKFLACGAFSRCMVIGRSREAECRCEPGFLSVDGLPCQSRCVVDPDFCPEGECSVLPGHGAVCRHKDGSLASGLSS